MSQQDQWIVSKPGILGGKPCLSGTRISVEFLLELLASGASPQDIRKAYPQVTEEGLAAAMRSHDPDPDARLELVLSSPRSSLERSNGRTGARGAPISGAWNQLS